MATENRRSSYCRRELILSTKSAARCVIGAYCVSAHSRSARYVSSHPLTSDWSSRNATSATPPSASDQYVPMYLRITRQPAFQTKKTTASADMRIILLAELYYALSSRIKNLTSALLRRAICFATHAAAIKHEYAINDVTRHARGEIN